MKTFLVGRTDLAAARKTIQADQHVVDETGDHVFFTDGEVTHRYADERIFVRKIGESSDRE